MVSTQISLKIIFLGDSDVGKTSILTQYTNNTFSDIMLNTIGIDYYTKKFSYEDTNLVFNYTDSAGQERYQIIPKLFFRNIDGVALVFDLTNSTSLQKIHYWHEQLKEEADIENIKFVLIGNKCDLKSKLEVTQDNLNVLISSIGNPRYFEASAKDNINIKESINYLENELLKDKHAMIYQERMSLKERQMKKKECCQN